MRTVDAVFVGSATLDALALVGRFPSADERVLADEIAYAGGGPAATAAVAAARLGVSTAFVGSVGDDANGRMILQGLSDEGVDVSGVSVCAGRSSASSVVVVDRTAGTRAICNRPGPDPDLSVGLDLIGAAAVVHVDHVGWAPVSRAGVLRAESVLSVDAGNPIEGFSPAGVGLYVPTVEALRSLHGKLPVPELLAAAISAGCATVVATDGARGSFAMTADGRTTHVPAHTTEIVSTLGAGDVFHGALVAAVVRGLALEDQLACANITAALACRGLDGRSTIPTWTEVADLMSRQMR